MKRQATKVAVQPRVVGIDVSHHQGSIKWSAVAKDPQGVRFAMVRTGDGHTPDRRCVENLRGARDVGLLVGAYHYVRGERMVGEQIDLALGAIREAFGCTTALDLPLCPDLEGGPDPDGSGPARATGAWQDLDPHVEADTALVLDTVRLFAELAEAATGRVPWIYGAVSIHWHVLQRMAPPAWMTRLPLWLPSYTSRPERGRPLMPVDRSGKSPWPAPLVWQHTAHGRVRGIPGSCDMNWALCTEDALRAG